MSEGSFDKGSSESSTAVDIPQFLQNFLTQGADTASGALGSLQGLAGQDLVAGFDPVQTQAQELAIQRATEEGGLIPTAQNTFLQTALGQALSDFLPEGALSTLSGAGGPLSEFIPANALEQFGSTISGGAVPSAATEALTGTAQGDFLFGGQGFDQAVEAATRAARPGILSAFGRAGAGGATGGLAQEAIGTSAIDAFARQFAQERQNQLGAAGTLGGFGLAEEGLGLDAASRLAGLSESERGRELSSAGLLANFGNLERNRQLTAAGQLPGLATADIGLLDAVGGARQDLAQQQLSAPFQQQLQLLMAALGGLPIESLLGQTTEGEATGFNLGF